MIYNFGLKILQLFGHALRETVPGTTLHSLDTEQMQPLSSGN